VQVLVFCVNRKFHYVFRFFLAFVFRPFRFTPVRLEKARVMFEEDGSCFLHMCGLLRACFLRYS